MKVYLDLCSIQRPLDTKSNPRISVEAEAVLGLLALCLAGQLDLVSSEALVFEAENNPYPVRKQYALEVLSTAKIHIGLDAQIEERARALQSVGIKPLDALHLASAEAAQADYFCTCDDRLLRRAQAAAKSQAKIVSPLDLITEVVK
ncbi:MAG TPA: PIN domain-containing protein [Thermoanaerobaculia bacterium]|jgi:predicted nucleic acid-binding protein|nr:PIN domain-containing protein [Thermoanaerobaculia bacterium]